VTVSTFRVTGDTVAGLVSLVVSLTLFWIAGGLPKSALVPIGPDFYPRMALGATALLSAVLVIEGVVAGLRPREPQAGVRPNYRLVVEAFAIVFLYVALLPGLGFRIATFLFVGVLQAVIEPPRSRVRWLTLLVVALVTTLVTYVVFERYLSVLLPRGRWTDF
jgi:putative tricarboxylic transport membrane protein